MVNRSREDDLRASFERMKSGDVLRVPKGTPVSQNNVAREADMEPSAFKKARYPLLIADIQQYIGQRELGAADRPAKPKLLASRPCADEQVKSANAERDLAMSKLMLAQVKIIELTKTLADYEVAEQQRLQQRRQ
ncbi:hypothetical protein [Pseudomonas viridiflava]|uniref:hypothetical protein n=1 Tax=Pseudomonas viridiflava TaxID=33069 RepID=UPI001C31390A|nr:hypothetical protein [Pseudomonas viridiflava]QXG47491.1 hypothetical protein KTT57_28765 [Pseudomonas viridiflava]